jgi:NAD(P)-dependent dehydrogenase (short-subunit alcohol dehydrogenase family)
MNIQVVLITGALTGVGRATAPAFAKEGVRIVISGGAREKETSWLLNSASWARESRRP